jgi:hypothetical protein
MARAARDDRQDLMLARIGLEAVPAPEPIKCDEFKDNVRVMYCINTQQLNPRFLRIMDEMAKTMGLTSDRTSILTSSSHRRVSDAAKPAQASSNVVILKGAARE